MANPAAKSLLAAERQINRVLREASREAAKRAGAITAQSGTSAAVRRAQLSAIHSVLDEAMVMNGKIIIDQAEAAAKVAALYQSEGVSARMLDSGLMNKAELTAYLDGVVTSAVSNVQTAVDALNRYRYDYSERVWRTSAITREWLDNAVTRAVATGQDPRALAKTISQWVSPDYPGGADYASKRLARTEITQAYHASARSRYIAQPWVVGVQWNLSASHSRPDTCNDLSDDAHIVNGPAGVFAPEEVPQQPHPNCLCFITPVVNSDKEFADKLANGNYDEHVASMGRSGGLNYDLSPGGRASSVVEHGKALIADSPSISDIDLWNGIAERSGLTPGQVRKVLKNPNVATKIGRSPATTTLRGTTSRTASAPVRPPTAPAPAPTAVPRIAKPAKPQVTLKKPFEAFGDAPWKPVFADDGTQVGWIQKSESVSHNIVPGTRYSSGVTRTKGYRGVDINGRQVFLQSRAETIEQQLGRIAGKHVLTRAERSAAKRAARRTTPTSTGKPSFPVQKDATGVAHSERVAKRYAKAFEEAADYMPDEAAAFTRATAIRLKFIRGNTLGHTSNSWDYIGINSNPLKWKYDSPTRGFKVPRPENVDAITRTVLHETGHRIYYSMSWQQRAELDNLLRADAADAGALMGDSYIKVHLSTYGATNEHEMAAEAWAEYCLYRGNPPGRIAKVYGDYVMRLLDQKLIRPL